MSRETNLVQRNMFEIMSIRRTKMGSVRIMQRCRGVAWPQLPWNSNNTSPLYCCKITCRCQQYKVVLSGKGNNGFPFPLLSSYKLFHNQICRINKAENNTCTLVHRSATCFDQHGYHPAGYKKWGITLLQPRAVILNRRALASIIPGRERFSWNLSF